MFDNRGYRSFTTYNHNGTIAKKQPFLAKYDF